MVEACGSCGGEYEPRLVSQTYELNGELIVVRDIPAEVCTRCGDVLLRPETARRIEELIHHHGESAETAAVYRLGVG